MIYLDKVTWQFKVLEGFKLKDFLKLKKKAFSRFTLAFNVGAPDFIKKQACSERGVFDMDLYFYTNDTNYSAWGSTTHAIELQLLYSEYGKNWVVLQQKESDYD